MNLKIFKKIKRISRSGKIPKIFRSLSRNFYWKSFFYMKLFLHIHKLTIRQKKYFRIGLIAFYIFAIIFSSFSGSWNAPVEKAEAVASWYSTNWTYRIKITVDTTKVSTSDQTNFPVYVNLADLSSSFFSHVAYDGSDIRVTSSDGTTEVPRQVVSVSTSSSAGELWFKAPTLSTSVSATNVFYIYYGNPDATEPSASSSYGSQNVWDSNYKGVWHLPNGTSLTLTDSTSSANNGSNVGTATATTGKVDGGASLNGTSQYISVGNSSTLAPLTSLTIEAWINPTNYTNFNGILGRTNGNAPSPYDSYLGQTNGKANFIVKGSGSGSNYRSSASNSAVSAGVWSHLVMVYDDTSNLMQFYINGSLDRNVTPTTFGTPNGVDSGNTTYIGVRSDLVTKFRGAMDEVRLSNTNRSIGWVTTEYNNQSSPSAFYSDDAEETKSCTAASTASSWYNSSWNYRMPLTISCTKVTSDLTSFPVVVNTTNTTWKSTENGGHVGKSDGTDIVFTDSSGNKLSHQIEKYTASTGELIAWVKVATLSASADTNIYVYYGNAGASDQQDSVNVWDANFKRVWHMGDASSPIVDSTVQGNGTESGGVTFGATGQIGSATTYDGSNDYIETSYTLPTNNFTFGGWAKSATSGVANRLMGNADSTGGLSGVNIIWGYTSSTTIYSVIRRGVNNGTNDMLTPAISNLGTGWHHIVVTMSSTGGEKIYVDGVVKASKTTTTNITSSLPFRIGRDGNGTDRFSGSVDDVKISNTARSGGWISTEYNNQSSPSTFYTLAAEGNNFCSAITTGDWSVGANWANCSGVGGIPATSDNVVIPTGINMTIDNSSAVANTIIINSGGTLTGGSGTVTISGTTGTLFTNSGTFTPGTSTVILSGSSGTPTATSGTFTGSAAFYNLTVTGSTDVKTLGSNITVTNALAINSGTLAASSYTVTLSGASGILFTLGASGNFNSGTSTVVFNPDADLNTAGTHVLTSGTFTGANQFNNVTLNPTITAARSYRWGAGAVTIGGALTVTNSSTFIFTVNLGATMTVLGTTTVQGTSSGLAILTTTSSNRAFTAGRIDCEANGRFNANASTVTLNATSGTLLKLNGSGASFSQGTSNVVISSDGGSVGTPIIVASGSPSFSTLTLSPTLTASRVYTLNDSTIVVGQGFTVNPSSSPSAFSLTVNLGGDLQGDFLNSGSTPISLTRTSSATTIVNTNNYTVGGDGTNYSFGIISVLTGATFNLGSSAVHLYNNYLSTPTFTITGTLSPGTSTVYMRYKNFTSQSIIFNSGTATFYNLNFPMDSSGTVTYTAGGAITVNNNLNINGARTTLDMTASNYALSAGTITIASTSGINARGSIVTLSGTGSLFTNSGTFTSGTSTIKLTNTSSTAKTFAGGGGTFYDFWIYGTGTGDYVITGSNTYHEFKDTNTGAHIIKFGNGTTQNMDTLTITGADASHLISLHSDSSGTQWNINTSNSSVDYADVKDGGCDPLMSDGSIRAHHSTNSGNNDACWSFAPPIIANATGANVVDIYTSGDFTDTCASVLPGNPNGNHTWNGTAANPVLLHSVILGGDYTNTQPTSLYVAGSGKIYVTMNDSVNGIGLQIINTTSTCPTDWEGPASVPTTYTGRDIYPSSNGTYYLLLESDDNNGALSLVRSSDDTVIDSISTSGGMGFSAYEYTTNGFAYVYNANSETIQKYSTDWSTITSLGTSSIPYNIEAISIDNNSANLQLLVGGIDHTLYVRPITEATGAVGAASTLSIGSTINDISAGYLSGGHYYAYVTAGDGLYKVQTDGTPSVSSTLSSLSYFTSAVYDALSDYVFAVGTNDNDLYPFEP